MSTLPHLPRQACWRLYCHVPGLLHFMTAEVARRLRALGHLLGLPCDILVDLVRCGGAVPCSRGVCCQQLGCKGNRQSVTAALTTPCTAFTRPAQNSVHNGPCNPHVLPCPLHVTAVPPQATGSYRASGHRDVLRSPGPAPRPAPGAGGAPRGGRFWAASGSACGGCEQQVSACCRVHADLGRADSTAATDVHTFCKAPLRNAKIHLTVPLATVTALISTIWLCGISDVTHWHRCRAARLWLPYSCWFQSRACCSCSCRS